MKFWTTLLFSYLMTEVAKGNRSIALNLKKPLEVGDEIVITGKGTGKWQGGIRLEDTRPLCNGRRRAVNPLVLVLQSRKKMMKIGRKTRGTSCRDGQFSTFTKVYEIGVGRRYTIKILINPNGYSVTVGNRNRFRTLYNNTRNSLTSVDAARARSGEYYSLNAKRTVNLPLVSDCGVRQSASGIGTRIAGGETSSAGNYPWQAAIRRKLLFTWQPIAHMCGGTLIDSCWVLTAAHCTGRIRNNEDDYEIRVGDYDNSDHAQPLSNEDEQNLAIDKVFIHEHYNQSVQNPLHDISLIRLKSGSEPGRCARTNSRFVTPACLPIVSTDDFPTNGICEISGWGASMYQQNVDEYPQLMKKGDVFLSDFDECKRTFGNGTDGKPRVRRGMICAGGDADTCQGDSGGPLACQRNRAIPTSPFVIWGITSWGDKCAAKGKPGVYTKVSLYMEWIMRTISMNID